MDDDIYDPLKNYLWPAERLEAERGRAGKGSGMALAGEEDEGGFRGLKAKVSEASVRKSVNIAS